MKTYTHTTITGVPAEALYRTIVDIGRWPEWDTDIEGTSHDGNLQQGARFTLKPKGGPKVAMEIVTAVAPTTFIDLSRLPLGRMRTSHQFTTQADGNTRIDVKVEVFGPLAFLWDRIVARKQAAGAEEQMRAFISYAERVS